MRKNLTKKEILRRRSDITRVFSSRNVYQCSGAKLILKKNGLNWNRILFTLVKRFGKSVQRNREKRVVREIYRNMKDCLTPGHDMVVIFYPGEFGYEERKEQLFKLFQAAKLVQNSYTSC